MGSFKDQRNGNPEEMIEVRRYSSELRSEWDALISIAPGATFLLKRDFMEYHSDRFEDHSMVVMDDRQLVAALPANQDSSGVIYSHQGLTYGGMVFQPGVKTPTARSYLLATIEKLKSMSCAELRIRLIPSVFRKIPDQMDEYLYSELDFSRSARDYSTAIDLMADIKWSHDRKNRLNKGLKLGLSVSESEDPSLLMELVEDNLMARFGKKPVHTREELSLLKSKFPANIRFITVTDDQEFLGGAVIFTDNLFIHTQYLHSNEEGKKKGAIEVLIDHLTVNHKSQLRYLSFGISTEQDGKYLNEGLLSFKESFGGFGVIHDVLRKKLN